MFKTLTLAFGLLTVSASAHMDVPNQDAKGELLRRVSADEVVTKKSSHTKRIVVVNGETVVDEETVDGKPVRKGSTLGRTPVGLENMDELLKKIGGDKAGNSSSSSSKSSHTKRVVVVNGETVVDEETVGGKPVTPRPGGLERPVGATEELGDLLRRMGETQKGLEGVDLDELIKQIEKDGVVTRAKAKSSASSKSESSEQSSGDKSKRGGSSKERDAKGEKPASERGGRNAPPKRSGTSS